MSLGKIIVLLLGLVIVAFVEIFPGTDGLVHIRKPRR